MAQTGQTPSAEPTPFESANAFPRRAVAALAAVVMSLAVTVAVISINDPEWLSMRLERHATMETPGGARKPADPAVLARYPALATGWNGSPIPFFPGQPAPTRWSVNLRNGAFIHVQTDIYLPDVVPINLSRTYSSFDCYSYRDFGAATSASYEIYLVGNNTVYSYIDMMFPDGSIVHMPRVSPGTSYNATYEHRAAAGDSADIFDQARLWWHSPWYFSSMKDGTGMVFPASRWSREWGQKAIIMIQDAKANVLDIGRDESGNILAITSPNGQKVVLKPDKKNRIVSANDSHGYSVYYGYDEGGRLTDVTDSKGNLTKYSYDIDNNMLTIIEPDGRTWLTNEYDKRHRVTGQTYLDGSHSRYSYGAPDPSGATTTQVTGPDGSIDTYTFNNQGALTNHTHQSPHT